MMNVSYQIVAGEDGAACRTNSLRSELHCSLREFDKCSPKHSRLPTHYLPQIIHPSWPHNRLCFFTRRFQKPRDDLEFGAGEGLEYHNTTKVTARVPHVNLVLHSVLVVHRLRNRRFMSWLYTLLGVCGAQTKNAQEEILSRLMPDKAFCVCTK